MTEDGWRVEVTRPAARDISRLDGPVRVRVLAALDGLTTDSPTGDIKRLTGIKPPRLEHARAKTSRPLGGTADVNRHTRCLVLVGPLTDDERDVMWFGRMD